MKRLILSAMILAVFFLEGIPVVCAADPVVKVLEVEGSVRMERANILGDVRVGDELQPGDRVITGENGRVLLQDLSDESLIKMAVSSELKISEEENLKSETRIFMRQGLIWGKKNKSGRVIRIETPLANLGVRGTEFFVKASSKQSELIVKEGRVRLEKEGVDAGDMTRVLWEDSQPIVFYGLTSKELQDLAVAFA